MIIDNGLALLFAITMVAIAPIDNAVVHGTLFCLSYLTYYFVPEALWGRTLGKRIHKLVVCYPDGKRAGTKAAFIRTILRLFEINPFLLGAFPGGLVVIFSKRKQRIGDMLANTVVVLESQIGNIGVAEQVTPPDSDRGSSGTPLAEG